MMIPSFWGEPWTAAWVNHLWQSTLVTLIAWLLALILRSNQARIRYWLWASASLKFLIPFSLLVTIGSHWAKPGGGSEVRSGLYFLGDQLIQPYPQSTTPLIVPMVSPVQGNGPHWFSVSLVAVWLSGFLTALTVSFLRWRRISQIVRRAMPIHEGREFEALRGVERAHKIVRPIGLLLSDDSTEPGIVGIVRPVLVWPAGISRHLDDAHLDTIIAHELAHVRRRDNLAAAIHMVVETVFWFHPLVWWLGSRMIEERERACDEEVLQVCSRPHVYAESILKVCQFCMESPLSCVSGVTGSNLKTRIVRIMSRRLGTRLSLARKMLLAAVAFVVLVLPLSFGVLHAMQAQRSLLHPVTSPPPSFAVATIKPSKDNSIQPGMQVGISPSNFTTEHSSVKDLIEFAYNVNSEDQIEGKSSWMSTERFDIQAKAAESDINAINKLPIMQQDEQLRLMLQSLLADRFQLKVNFMTKEIPVYALVIAKGGEKLKEVEVSPLPPPGTLPPPGAHLPGIGKTGANRYTATAWSMKGVAEFLSRFEEVGHRLVVDETGLKGHYDFVLNGISMGPSADGSTTSIFTAIQEQLGLKLVPRKAPVEVLQIDHVERPSEN